MGRKVSLREYARIRGVRLNAVQTAIASGRIHKTPDGKIDVDEANKEWFMNTDPAKSRKADPLFEAQPELSGGGRQNFFNLSAGQNSGYLLSGDAGQSKTQNGNGRNNRPQKGRTARI